jgi:alkylation response protein AidB-like acyl-CoA dehydrogenase
MEASPQVLLRPLCPAALTAEVKDRFGELIATCINPGAGERDRTATPFSRELVREAGRLGLTGFTLPREIGGQGRSWREWGMVLHEIGYLCDDTAFPMLLAYLGTLTKLLHQTGRQDLADRYVVPMVRGECLGGFGWSEGHDPFSLQTVIRRDGDGYILDGEKVPIADGLIADVFMIFARSAENGDVMVVLVDRDDRGVEVTPYPAMGVRAAGMARVRFSDVHLNDSRVLVRSDGISYGQRFLNERRFEMPCWLLGRMRVLFETCVDELSRRIRFRLPLTEMQAVQAAIGRMYVGMETARLVVADTLERIGRDEQEALWDPALAVSKYHVVGQALEMCRTAQHVLGGAAVFEARPYSRLIRDIQCLVPIAGTLATLEVDLGVLVTAEIERAVGARNKREER